MHIISLKWSLVLSLLFCPTVLAEQERDRIKLVLQVTVDGLRADLLERYRSGFGDKGFRYLLERGTVYTDAHYRHANTETIVGHTTLATGAQPSRHGMVGNVWFDREAGELAYNIEDAEAPILPSREESASGEQVDPAQLRARTSGRSPVALLVPTLADTMAAYSAGISRSFAVSGKDRSAVAMAGKTGKAFWFSVDNGDFVTSRYYYDAYPAWVEQWNRQRKAEKLTGTGWALSFDPQSYLFADRDDRPYEVDLRGFGRTFPHIFTMSSYKVLFTQVQISPFGDRLLLDFSKRLIESERLGQNGSPDYLSISFSSVDAVNHFFGPSSLENEDVVRSLDATLADLFGYVDEAIGLEHTLIVLSADHGMADMPEYLTELGYSAGRLEPEDIVDAANQAGKKLGLDKVVRFFYRPYIYLDEQAINDKNLDYSRVLRSVAAAVTDLQGVRLAAVTREPAASMGDGLQAMVRNNQHAERSGDIYVAQEPYWFLFDEGPIAAMHGSPWKYDTHVPIMFAGPGIAPRRVHRRVEPADVAPTLAAVLGMSPPAGAQGRVLEEVLGNSAP